MHQIQRFAHQDIWPHVPFADQVATGMTVDSLVGIVGIAAVIAVCYFGG